MMVRVYRNGGHYSHVCEMKASTPLVLEPARTYILTYIHIHIWVGLTMGYTPQSWHSNRDTYDYITIGFCST
jgi:hypothetical protein